MNSKDIFVGELRYRGELQSTPALSFYTCLSSVLCSKSILWYDQVKVAVSVEYVSSSTSGISWKDMTIIIVFFIKLYNINKILTFCQ